MQTNTASLKKQLEEGGVKFKKIKGSDGAMYWEARLGGVFVAMDITLADCIRKAASALGESQ